LSKRGLVISAFPSPPLSLLSPRSSTDIDVPDEDCRQPQRVAARRPRRGALLPVAQALARLRGVGFDRRRRVGDVLERARVDPREQEVERGRVAVEEHGKERKRDGNKRTGEESEHVTDLFCFSSFFRVSARPQKISTHR
jgi:hypothetical protein